MQLNNKKGPGYDCAVPFLFFLPVTVPCCTFPLYLSLASNHCGELQNNLLVVRSAEWILLLIVEMNTLFEYDQSPAVKGLLWFIKYSSKVSPGDSDAFRCISQNRNRLQQTKDCKQWLQASELSGRQSQMEWPLQWILLIVALLVFSHSDS